LKGYKRSVANPSNPCHPCSIKNEFMPINQNHLFEELDGVKCSIVEKNASPVRVEFLKNLLEYNGYTVVVAATPAPKAAPAKPAPKPVPAATVEGTESPAPAPVPPVTPEAPPPPPSTFTVGVTDLIFNPTNAIFGRLLRTPDGHVVTLAYWQQKEEVPHDEVPYYERKL
jgi:hypothetical protein